MATIPKTYEYKVYDSAGNYLGNLANVANEFAYSQEINSAGGQVVITLAAPADNFGEGGIVAFRNKVVVNAIDADAPNGVTIFQGYMADYKPVFGDQEHVEITVLGYGAELDNYIIGTTEVADQSSLTGSATEDFSINRSVAQAFVPSTTPLTSVDLKLFVDAPQNVTLQICPTSGSGNYPDTTSVLASVTVLVSNTTMATVHFPLATPLTLTTGSKYWLVLT